MTTQPMPGGITRFLVGIFALAIIVFLATSSGQLNADENDETPDGVPPVEAPPDGEPPDQEPGRKGPPFDVPPVITPAISVPAVGRRIDASNLPDLGGLGRGFERTFVDIPPGAIVREIAMKIGKPEYIPPGKSALQALEFTIEGHQGRFEFAEPVTIGIPLPEELDGKLALTILYWNTEQGDWEPITLPKSIVLDRARGVISALVTHFSVYGVHYADEQLPTAVQDQSWGQIKSVVR